MIYLTRIDPARNMARFYALSLQRDLFGGVALVTEWGRIGQAGTRRHAVFSDAPAATAALSRQADRKRRRGYTPRFADPARSPKLVSGGDGHGA